MRVPSAHPLSTSNACSQKVKTTQRKLHGIQQVRKTTIITTTTTTTKKKTAHILDIMKFMSSEKLHGCVYQEDAFTLNGINMSD